MPGFDGTGPSGEGPMTGGGFGYCNPARAGYGRPYGRGYGYDRGFGFGRGRGLRRGFGPLYGPGRWYGPGYGAPYPPSPSEEISMLKAEAEAIKGDLEAINRRIGQLESESPK